MRYLKIVNSFDDFSEQARAGCVYYHPNVNVYYWLNLRTIWGYIGYVPSTRKFVTNGTEYSVIPSVPDPENLSGPVIVDTNSFIDLPDVVTLKYSDFPFVPIDHIYGLGNFRRIIVECDDDSEMDTLYFVDNVGRTEVEFKDFDLSKLRKIEYGFSGAPSYSMRYRIVIGDGNGTISSALSLVNSSRQYRTAAVEFVCEKSGNIFDFSMVLPSSAPKMGNVFVDCSKYDTVILDAQYDPGFVSVPKCRVAVKYGANMVFRGTGELGRSTYTEYLSCFNENKESVGLGFSDITYEGFDNYQMYYKPYLVKPDYLAFPDEMIEYCKTQSVSVFYQFTATDGDWSEITKTNIDLSEIGTFAFYESSYPVISAEVGLSDDYVSDLRNYGGGVTRIGSFSVQMYMTPRISNVNTSIFGLGVQTTTNRAIVINTNDSSVRLGTIGYMTEPSSYFNLFVEKAHIYISGFSRISRLEVMPYININANYQQGVLHFYKMNPSPSALEIALAPPYPSSNVRIYDISEAVDSANPTSLDYYNTRLETSRLMTVGNDNIDSYITRSRVVFRGNSDVPLSKIKCLAGGADFSMSSQIVSHSDILALMQIVPDRNVTDKDFTFNSAQYAILDASDIDYFVNLGYRVIEYVG